MNEFLSAGLYGLMVKLVFLPLLVLPYVGYLILTNEKRKKSSGDLATKEKPTD